MINTSLLKRTFSKIRIPLIKFLGDRNKLLFKKEEKQEEHKKNVEKRIIRSGFMLSKSNEKSYVEFLNNFNQTKSDFDIFRQEVTEEEMKNVNYIEYSVEDWRKVKYIG